MPTSPSVSALVQNFYKLGDDKAKENHQLLKPQSFLYLRYHDLPKRTGTDRNGPERTETDFRGYRNGLSEYRNGLSGNRNGPERTETDFRGYRNGLSEYRNGLSGNRNGPERTETDFCEYRNGLCGYRIVIWGVKIDRNAKNRYKLLCQAVQIGYVE